MGTNNLFVINKPKNITSNQVIQQIKWACKLKKIGHGGTLDPLATGVLVIGINHATKLLQTQLQANKTYLATIEFGYQTDTYDIDGKITNKSGNMQPSIDEIIAICENWKINDYYQQVPLYSAVKHHGIELYKIARAGQLDVIPPTKLVQLINYKVASFKNNILIIELNVAKGFYVRSFANDLGLALHGYATLIDLCRLQSGEHTLDHAYTIEELIAYLNLPKHVS